MKRFKIPAIVLVVFLCLCGVIAGCNEPDSGNGNGQAQGSVTGIQLKYNGSAIPNDSLTVDLSVGTLTFTADVQTTGGASKDFTLKSSASGIASVLEKTVTLIQAGTTTITATAVGDTTKKHEITLTVEDNGGGGTGPFSITVTGGTADKTSAMAGETVTLTPGTQAGKVFTDWTINPPSVVMISANSFQMPSANVTVTGNFETEVVTPGTKPYYITNNFDGDSSTGFIVQWHNNADVITQNLQIVKADGSFDNAQTITVTGASFSQIKPVGVFAARNIFRTKVTGLSPNTLYKYRMGAAGAWSDTYYHTTSSGTAAAFSFTVVSDPQSDAHSDMQATLRAADAFDTDSRFYLMGGDVVNEIGKVPAEIVSYTEAATEFNKYRPIAATQGNHDTYYDNGTDNQYRFGESTVFNAFVAFPDNGWDTHADKANRSQSYYFYYNKVLVIVLNTMATSANSGTAEPNHTAQANWLKEILEKDRTEKLSNYRIVITHVSPLSGRDTERWLTPGVRSAYGKICTDNAVDIFFAGHDHVYARSNPIKIGTNTALNSMNFNETEGGTIFSIVSATGPKFYTIDNANGVGQYFPVKTDASTPGVFVNVKVTAEKLIVTAKRLGVDTPLDTYQVTPKP